MDAGYVLEELFSKIVIPEQVYQEIMNESTPLIVKRNFENLKESFVEIREIYFPSQEYVTYKSIEKGFWSKTGKVCGSGESAAMALAHLNNGIVASNNLSDVLEYIEDLDIGLITSSMILTEALKKEIISIDLILTLLFLNQFLLHGIKLIICQQTFFIHISKPF